MEEKKKKKRIGIIPQVALLFAIGIIVTGVLAYLTQYERSREGVQEEIETISSQIAQEVKLSLAEFTSEHWLLQYWCDNYENLDGIEYDLIDYTGTKTAENSRILSEKYPGLQLKYATKEDIEAMSPEDQKVFAEICYTRLITRVNEIKRAHKVDYLFCVLTDDTYSGQFFIFSAAEHRAKRGTSYTESYPIGVSVSVNESQSESMRMAQESNSHLADAGDYVDFYSFLGNVNGKPAFIGITYNLTGILSNIARQTVRGTVIAIVYQVLLSSICIVLLYLFVLNPLKKLQRNIRRFTETKDSERVHKSLAEMNSRSEIGEISDDFATLTSEIDKYVKEIETISADKERIETELTLATRIQEDMIPNTYPAFPNRQEFDIYGEMDPAKEVGGDFYDFFLIDDDHLCLEIADVSGKGIPAALFMMASKIILANKAMAVKSPAWILSETNNMICPNNKEEMFVTVWIGILEISTGKLTAANAGHEYPILKNGNGEFEIIKDKHGFVIGGMEGSKYTEYELKLEPGSKLFLYTDGLPEATSEEDTMFGMDRIVESLKKVSDGTPEEILKSVRKDVDVFVKEAEQFDDLTMLCLEYKGVN